jgi:small-conductance mechanosensitive channel
MNYIDFLDQTLFRIRKMDVTNGDVLLAAGIIIGTWLFLWWLKKMLKLAESKGKLSDGQIHAIYSLTKYLLIVLAIVMVLETIHVRITLLLAGSAALLVGIGLGLQQLANDLVCGVLILIENTIKLHDIIEVDGAVAKVQEIGLRTSKVENRDGITMIIPNSKIISEKMINWTANRHSTRFNVKVGVAYGSDVQLVKEILLDAGIKHKDVVKHPKPIVRFIDFGQSSLDFELLFWSKNRFRIEDVKSDIRFFIDESFREKKVVIPFPQRDLHVKSWTPKPGSVE